LICGRDEKETWNKLNQWKLIIEKYGLKINLKKAITTISRNLASKL
jgi:hypothetical protein